MHQFSVQTSNEIYDPAQFFATIERLSCYVLRELPEASRSNGNILAPTKKGRTFFFWSYRNISWAISFSDVLRMERGAYKFFDSGKQGKRLLRESNLDLAGKRPGGSDLVGKRPGGTDLVGK